VDVAIITVRSDEFVSVVERLPEHVPLEGERHKYELASLPRPIGRPLRVAVGRSLEQDPQAAQGLTQDMLHEFSPAWLLVVGISGGVPHDEFSLGDVVLSSTCL
jgi:nucleoside phosphorylase